MASNALLLTGAGASGAGVLTSETIGTWPDTPTSTRTTGTSSSIDHAGFRFTPSVSATVTQVKWNVNVVNTSGTFHFELWSDSAGSPGTQIGSDGDGVLINSTGDKTLTHSSPPSVTSGTPYWIIFQDAGTGSIDVQVVANNASYGSGRHNTITSIADGQLPSSEDYRVEVTIE